MEPAQPKYSETPFKKLWKIKSDAALIYISLYKIYQSSVLFWTLIMY